MAMGPKLELRQSQALVMTPQLQQAIKLLQLSNLDLNDYVERELESNPLLERDEGEPAISDDAGMRHADADPSASDKPKVERPGGEELVIPDDGQASKAAETSIDSDYESLHGEDSAADAAVDYSTANGSGLGMSQADTRGFSGGFDNPDYNLENMLSETLDLRDHLRQQLSVTIGDPVGRIIGAYLIDSIDECGYLTEPTEQIAERLGCDLAQVEATLAEVQQFDPCGVFARDLGDCLGLQLRDQDRLDPAMQALLKNLDLVARRDIPRLTRICGVDAEDIADMLSEIRELDPKPGLALAGAEVQTLIPDVYVSRDAKGGWHLELNTETLPRVLVNNRYAAKVGTRGSGKDTKAFLSDCLNSANWLVKSLDQRANTILRVATEIVLQQEEFLERGVQFLKPLNLRMVADAISMHESTVSRVTSNKYMATPRGIFELKYFFTSAIASADGLAAHSAESVRHRIKELVDAEAVVKILSDDKIVEILQAEDIDIARRTVAKYREAMRIPSSVQRRRLKKMLA